MFKYTGLGIRGEGVTLITLTVVTLFVNYLVRTAYDGLQTDTEVYKIRNLEAGQFLEDHFECLV